MGRSTVITNINQALPTNGSDEISAQDLRGVLIADVVNEFMNLEDDAEIPVYNALRSYKLGKLVLNQNFIWKALVNVMPNQNPPTLPTTLNAYWQVQGFTTIALNEATQPEIELETSTEAGKFVSPRRFWQGIARFKALVGTFLEKITFGKGVSLGNNIAPANGDMWYNSTTGKLQVRVSGVNENVLTDVNIQSQAMLMGTLQIINGSNIVFDTRITAISELVGYGIKSGGSISSVPFQYTIPVAGQMQIFNNQATDNGFISYTILV